MAHHVEFNVPSRPVGAADIQFSIRRDGRKFGYLRVSKGTVVWIPADKSYGYRLNWNQLDRLFREDGKRHKPSF